MEAAAPPIVSAITDAFEKRCQTERERAALWLTRYGWRFADEPFEETLLEFVWLTDDERSEMRAWRADHLDKQAA